MKTFIFLIISFSLINLCFGEISKIGCIGGELDVGWGASPIVTDWNGDGKIDLIVGESRGYVYLFLNKGSNKSPLFTMYSFIQVSNEDLCVFANAHPFVCDWNEDGRKDLLVASGKGYIYLFINYGKDGDPEFIRGERLKTIDGKLLTVGYRSSPCLAVADWNGDGKKDLLIGDKEGHIGVYLNVGKDFDPKFNTYSKIELSPGVFLKVPGFSTPFVCDWNKDGKSDLIVGDSEGRVNLFLNYGDSKNPILKDAKKVKFKDRELDVGWFSRPVFMDWNSDGRKDLIVGEKRGNVYVYLNSADTSPVFRESFKVKIEEGIIDVGRFSSPMCVDWNQDGKEDLLIGEEGGHILLYKNIGSNKPLFTKPFPIQNGYAVIDVGTFASPFVCDWNNDNRLDIICGNYDGKIITFLNLGKNRFRVKTEDIDVSLFSTPFVCDWNNDKRKDLLVGDIGGYVNLYLNKGTDASPIFGIPQLIKIKDVNLDVGSYSSPCVFDWNGDGKKDLIVGNEEGDVKIFLNYGSDKKPIFIDPFPIKINVGRFAKPCPFDWNGDGRPDLIIGNEEGEIYLFINE
ncbi:MAG: VCBS repeat-containing protein [bacterium]|nr:VCBS repeat-containing protein [bacterium]